MPKTRSKKWHVALKVSVVLMLLACIITPIVRHYFVYWVNLSTHSSPEDPYFIINGFAEDEEDYDPFVQEMRSSWEDALYELDEEYGLDGVFETQGTRYFGTNDTNPQPNDLGSQSIDSTIYFDNEEDTRKGLVSLGNYYIDQGYTHQGHEAFTPYQKFYPETWRTDEENAQGEREFVVEPVQSSWVWKYSEEMSMVAGTQAQAHGTEYNEQALSLFRAFILDDHSIMVTYHSSAFPLSTLPKFGGNAKLLDMDRLKPNFNMMDGTTAKLECPFESTTFEYSGWNPNYGCLDN